MPSTPRLAGGGALERRRRSGGSGGATPPSARAASETPGGTPRVAAELRRVIAEQRQVNAEQRREINAWRVEARLIESRGAAALLESQRESHDERSRLDEARDRNAGEHRTALSELREEITVNFKFCCLFFFLLLFVTCVP